MSFLRRLFGGAGSAGEPADGDAAVIAQLVAVGADLGLPRPVDFFLYFPTEAAARQAGDRVAGEAREVTVQPAASGPMWLVQVVETMVVDLDAMHARTDEFGRISRELAGEYDGWGAPA
jgi:hypothetical protein